jgi:hypothetical protein
LNGGAPKRLVPRESFLLQEKLYLGHIVRLVRQIEKLTQSFAHL